MELKDTLKQIREEHGLTKRELCQRTGISERAYLTYEFGEREPKISVIQKLADFYDVTTDYLLGRPNAKQPEDPINLAAREFQLDSAQRGILAAYLYMKPADRKQFVKYIKQIADGTDEEDTAKKSDIQKRTNPTTYDMQASVHSDSNEVIIDGHTMTKEQLDIIQNTPEMDENL